MDAFFFWIRQILRKYGSGSITMVNNRVHILSKNIFFLFLRNLSPLIFTNPWAFKSGFLPFWGWKYVPLCLDVQLRTVLNPPPDPTSSLRMLLQQNRYLPSSYCTGPRANIKDKSDIRTFFSISGNVIWGEINKHFLFLLLL